VGNEIAIINNGAPFDAPLFYFDEIIEWKM
jgi:hypothetical protein